MPVRTKKNDPIMVACEHKVSSNIGAILSKCNTILHSFTFYIFECIMQWKGVSIVDLIVFYLER